MKAVSFLALALLLVGCARPPSSLPTPQQPGEAPMAVPEPSAQHLDLAAIDARYRFSIEVPAGWRAEYVPATQAVNIYDPAASASSTLEKSQIFIRMFEADRFLTLATVDVVSRTEDTVSGHAAVRYEIQKKAGVPNFFGQPSWRSGRHRLVDVRLAPSGRTTFYVFAANPSLDPAKFERVLASLRFDDDVVRFVPPLDRATERVSKKQFGTRVSPQSSPVQPERFSGYHTGVDYETFPDEADVDVPVRAICSGPIAEKRTASGYGGLAVQSCVWEDESVTVVYGHLRLSSVVAKVGDRLAAGDLLGVLGTGGTAETDGERRHLHLGIHRGQKADVRGYVPSDSGLLGWMDPLLVFDESGAGS